MVRLIISACLLCLYVWRPATASLIEGSAGSVLEARIITKFVEPWAMTFINGEELIVTSKRGKLWLVSTSGKKTEILGVPRVAFGGQGGLGDVVLHPNFRENKLIYLSFIQADRENPMLRGAVIFSCKLETSIVPKLTHFKLIWTQTPKMPSLGHFSHRIVFGPKDSRHEGKLFITSGDRQVGIMAQSTVSSLGKIIRVNDDGTIPDDNPFQNRGELAKSFWTLGHRNALGIAFDEQGTLWSHEMGPKHGDELNVIQSGKNYGWPLVSEGNHYDGRTIQNHDTRPSFVAPAKFWIPTIAPSGLFFYDGPKFQYWKGNAFIGGLKSKALIRIEFFDLLPREAERFNWGSRVREVEQGPDGSIWVLEDPPFGRLIQFNPPQ